MTHAHQTSEKKRFFSLSFSPVLMVIFLSIGIGVGSTYFLGEYAKTVLLDDARVRVHALARIVDLEFKEIENSVTAIAQSPSIVAQLRDGTSGDYGDITDALDHATHILRGDLSFVVNTEGRVVATSPVPPAKEFVGEDVRFRPYFQQAAEGNVYHYFAVGTTTKTPGLYVSAPIYHKSGDIIGVAVIKHPLTKIKEYLAQFSHCFVVNDEGVVFLASNDRYSLRILWPLSTETFDRMVASRQFGDDLSPEPLFKKRLDTGTYQTLDGLYHYTVREFLGKRGWSIVLCMPANLIMVYTLVGILGTVLFAGLCIAFMTVITIKDRSARLLIDSEKRYQALFESSSDAIFLIDDNGVFDCNHEALTMFSLESKESIKACCPSSMCVAIQPNGEISQEYMTSQIAKAYVEGKIGFEFLFKREDSFFVGDVRLKSFDINDKKIIRMTVRDITQQKKMEESLRKLSRAVEQSPSSVVITDLSGSIEYVNKKFTELTGYSLEEIKGQTPRVLKSGEQSDEFYANFWRVISSGKEWRGEFHNKKKNGERYWERATVSPIIDEGLGVATHYLGLKEDITLRKETEQALQESEEKYRSLFEDSNDAVFIHDPEGKMIDVNQRAADMTGYAIDELLTMNMHDIHVATTLSTQEIIATVVAGTAFFGETHMRRKDGSIFEIEVNLSATGDEHKNLQGVVRDITERKKVEKLKDDFVSTVSHELRTPLTIIKEGASLVLDGVAGELNENQRNILETTQQNVDRLSRLINDLLDMSKIEAGKFDLKKTWFSMTDLLREMQRTFSGRAKAVGLECRIDEAEDEVAVYADRDTLVQVFINLVGNALKFTDAGFIEIGCQDTESGVRCWVKDTGPGLAQNEVQQLFEKFRQFGRKEGAGEKGTGLGLSIVKGIVELHKGDISVDSVIGEGTTFTIVLPAYTARMVFCDDLSAALKHAAQDDVEVTVLKLMRDTGSIDEKSFLDAVHRCLRGSEDRVRVIDDAVCVMLYDCGYNAAQEVVKRMLESVHADMLQYEQVRYAVFPHDGATAKDMCDVIF